MIVRKRNKRIQKLIRMKFTHTFCESDLAVSTVFEAFSDMSDSLEMGIK